MPKYLTSLLSIDSVYSYTKITILLYIIFLFTPHNYSSLSLIILIVVFIYESLQLKQIKFHRTFLLFSSILIIYIFNFILFGFNIKDLEKLCRLLPILIFPIIFYNIQISKKWFKLYLLCYLISLIVYFISIIFCVTVYYFNIEDRPHLRIFNKAILYGQVMIPKWISFHTPYIGLYLLFGCIISYNLFFESKNKLYVCVYIILLVLMFYFTGRSSLFLALLFFISLCYRGLIKKHVIIQVLSYSFLFFIFYKILYLSPMLYDKILNIFNKGFGLYQRKLYYDATFHLLKNGNIFLGLGHTNYKVNLSSILPPNTVINLHNQYLEFLAFSGLLGFVAYLLFKLILVRFSLMNRDVYMLFIICAFSLLEITESLLYRQRGIFIFSFLVPLFYYRILHEQSIYKVK